MPFQLKSNRDAIIKAKCMAPKYIYGEQKIAS